LAYTVLIVDDHELFSTSLRIALSGHGIAAHQASPSSKAEVLRRAGELEPGLVVLDLDLGKGDDGLELNGSELVAGLRTIGWKVLVVSGKIEQSGAAAAVAGGAIGVIAKTSSFESLLHTVVKAASGQQVMTESEYQGWVARHRASTSARRELERRLSQLSRREREVLDLLAEGHRAAAIADKFVVSMTTVRTQIRSILAKLEVNSQLEAVALARQYQDRL
jgi:DNA-binding NarL/FixJ family response regulator